MSLEFRYLFYRFIALCGLILSSPFLAVAFIAVKIDSPGPFIFKQKRMGKGKKPFTMYKIRTMVSGAEGLQVSLKKKNEADGPVFKIKNDPRFTKVGKFLSYGALDEIPQLINVIRGEMSLVGPRPLPLEEAKKIPAKYAERFTVLPGMTSSWVIHGSHRLTFKEWMRLDIKYARKHPFLKDLYILLYTFILVLRIIFQPFFK